MARLLIADDETTISRALSALLKADGHEVDSVTDGKGATEAVKKNGYDLVVVDIRMGEDNGIDVFKAIKKIQPDIAGIVMTGWPEVETALQAVELGAYDYVTKPLKLDAFMETVRNAVGHREGATISQDQKIDLDYTLRFGKIIAESPQMQEICDNIERIAVVNVPVLLQSAEGSGKALLAEAIHQLSGRDLNSFKMMDAASEVFDALETKLFGTGKKGRSKGGEPGLFQELSNGTIYIGNIDLIPTLFQDKLAEVLTEKYYTPIGSDQKEALETRLIFGAGKNLELITEQGQFSKNLFKVISPVTFYIPDLHERSKDIMPLADIILQKLCKEKMEPPKFTRESLNCLIQFPWEKNADELEDVINKILIEEHKGLITKNLLPYHIAEYAEKNEHLMGSVEDGFQHRYLKRFFKNYQERTLALLADADLGV